MKESQDGDLGCSGCGVCGASCRKNVMHMGPHDCGHTER
jgi:MinD superfamily P-loop ATPase